MVKMTFRWYGEEDPVTLEKIRQIPGVTGIVSAVYSVPPGKLWSQESIRALKAKAAAAGLGFEVVESVPVHEEIKLGGAGASERTDVFCENLRRLGREGITCVCYNFMPVFDWVRSELSRLQPDGARALAYDEERVLAMDPAAGGLSLPGWDESYTPAGLQTLLSRYKDIGEEELWRNLERFLQKAVPAAEEAGIRLAIHPDDPPWGLFGLPRIITCENNIDRLLGLADSPANGLTFCTGSLGASEANDLPRMAAKFAKRIPFAHLRNIRRNGHRCFEETAHPSACGTRDMFAIVKALEENGFDGYVRPDHGRMIWGEEGRPGYGLYDRALGAAYLTGLFEAAEKSAATGRGRTI